jgi:hypothetical protein
VCMCVCVLLYVSVGEHACVRVCMPVDQCVAVAVVRSQERTVHYFAEVRVCVAYELAVPCQRRHAPAAAQVVMRTVAAHDGPLAGPALLRSVRRRCR